MTTDIISDDLFTLRPSAPPPTFFPGLITAGRRRLLLHSSSHEKCSSDCQSGFQACCIHPAETYGKKREEAK